MLMMKQNIMCWETVGVNGWVRKYSAFPQKTNSQDQCETLVIYDCSTTLNICFFIVTEAMKIL